MHQRTARHATRMRSRALCYTYHDDADHEDSPSRAIPMIPTAGRFNDARTAESRLIVAAVLD